MGSIGSLRGYEMISRETVEQDIDELEVRLISHRTASARGVSSIAAWAPLFGYKRFKETVWMTLRPYIIHPVGIIDPFDYWPVMAHELAHWKRQPDSRLKLMWWVIRYGTSQRVRAVEEMHAHLVDLETKRLGDSVPHIVEKMRDWYRLNRIDPQWMIDWMSDQVRGDG